MERERYRATSGMVMRPLEPYEALPILIAAGFPLDDARRLSCWKGEADGADWTGENGRTWAGYRVTVVGVRKMPQDGRLAYEDPQSGETIWLDEISITVQPPGSLAAVTLSRPVHGEPERRIVGIPAPTSKSNLAKFAEGLYESFELLAVASKAPGGNPAVFQTPEDFEAVIFPAIRALAQTGVNPSVDKVTEWIDANEMYPFTTKPTSIRRTILRTFERFDDEGIRDWPDWEAVKRSAMVTER